MSKRYELKPGKRWEREVWNGKDKYYKFMWNGSVLACSCPSWRFSKVHNSQRTCIHTRHFYPDYEPAVDNPLVKLKAPKLPLFTTYDEDTCDLDLTEFYYSIKHDGVRAIWDGEHLVSRSGIVINAPAELVESLPADTQLDGELVAPTFEQTLLAIQGGPSQKIWNSMLYMVFDSPQWPNEPFSERYQRLLELEADGDWGFKVCEQHRIKSKQSLKEKLERLTKEGYEGIVLKHPDALYRAGRNAKLSLKWKLVQTGEADILQCDGERRCEIRVHSPREVRGKTVWVYLAPHEKVSEGDRVPFTYRGVTGSGKPRFARVDL